MQYFKATNRLSLRQQIMRHKGRHCEATLWCWRRPAGSIVVVPQDAAGNDLETLAIWVCGVHKQRAMEAAREWAQAYEDAYNNKIDIKEAK